MSEVHTYAQLAAEIYAAPPRLGQTRLVTVDGPSGSGKTAFARRLAAALGPRRSVAIVEIEALYEGWSLEGSWQRLRDYVLEPIAAGWVGGFHPFDWTTLSWSPRWCAVPITDVLVVEGCGSSPLAAQPFISRLIWIEAPADVALARGLDRPGVDLDRHLLAWQQIEAAHFQEQKTRQRAHVHVDGGPAEGLSFDPDLGFTTLP